ncbi:MAG: nucleoid-associated protein [Arenicella sp.]|jgi:nucleoid-associated protein
MDLKNIIFHGLVTEQHVAEVSVIERNEELLLPNENAAELVSEARQSYNKDSGISYAEFGNGWFPDYLNQLIDEKISFKDFSVQGLTDLKERMERKPLTTGGHLFFIRYEEGESDFIMTLLLKDTSGFIVQDLTISESHILNLDKLHFGARINISKWKNNEGTYISFLKGSNRQDITEYFRDFLSINEATFNDPGRNTLELVQAIKEYCHTNCESEEEVADIKSRLKSELERRVEDRQTITMEAISALVDPDNASSFTEFVNDSDFEIQPEFRPDKTKLRKLSRYSGRTSEISISFGSDALEDGVVSFDDSGNEPKLIVSKIPPKLLEELRLNTVEGHE